jgi:hypothetical protein
MNKTEERSAAERLLDQAIELTFPASDPIAVDSAFRSARKRDQREAGAPTAPDKRRAGASGDT